ncbi:arf-GAP with coiled-coil, ANK repeat and PH domain-containing protein 2-like [Anneissia japonica]|uniref:arf-GAP with coiled-coil, ANK repeat and PH domain-containing protein 2-like n=1 Tax=Anneissia japonica TaxID=1529436 RepID=UPI001425AB33|nr:arf-GAP with coiled-coil, ANK repeat and PH domain-containing protein 2-like [Anneissia japonica]
MIPKISFDECLKDSPRFRASLEDVEVNIFDLECRLEKLVKLCSAMVEAGKVFNAATGAFVSGINDVKKHFDNDKLVEDYFDKFIRSLKDVQSYHSILIDQANRTICKSYSEFLKGDLKKVKDTKRAFYKISEDFDTSLNKHAQVSRSKAMEAEEAGNLLIATRSAFGHTALDYVKELNMIQSAKRHEILNNMMSFMHAQFTYFHQGYDLLRDRQPQLKQLAVKLDAISKMNIEGQKEMERRHAMVEKLDEIWNNPCGRDLIDMEGYLYKRANNAFKSWHRRWFTLRNNQLVYQKRSKDDCTIAVEDLRLCTVKFADDCERRFCFDVVLPGKTIALQADSESIRKKWSTAFAEGINSAFNISPSNDVKNTYISNTANSTEDDSILPSTSRNVSFRSTIQGIPGNEICCDCRNKDPTWASINLGVTLCIECSGVHRSLGVHISKVRSLTLDAWEPETLKVMDQLGNIITNSIYEANADVTMTRAKPGCLQSVRLSWIRDKYVNRKFVSQEPGSPTSGTLKRRRLSQRSSGGSLCSGLSAETLAAVGIPPSAFGEDNDSDNSDAEILDEPPPDKVKGWKSLDANARLIKASGLGNVSMALEALAQGGNINPSIPSDARTTPLHEAVAGGSLTTVEFLLLNGSKVNSQDANGRTPLHIATDKGYTGFVCLMLKRGADQDIKDKNGQNVLSISINKANADIVTLLRLAKLNKEMKESSDYGNQGDETFQDVFRDFTNMASNNPDKLNRNQSSDNIESTV